ncbi:cytochrome c biogenesis protein transmembrane region [Clostridium sp. CAG:1193]|nr:cytochrome c biogenesis protein transmembrane region [Clostridium sp. CAG:1193]
MKKKLLSVLFTLLLLIPLGINAEEKEKVKVYIFEAGGCPYCEAEVEYLKGLEGYNKTFTIEIKELYIDHVDWKPGKDYDLGVKVANGFLNVGFTDASYQGTPFVVISDLYAASAYSTSLESVINEAYEKGDKDIVSCYADGKEDCLNHLAKEDNKVTDNDSATGANTWVVVVMGLLVIGTIIVKSTIDTNRIVEAINSKNYKIKDVKESKASNEPKENTENKKNKK